MTSIELTDHQIEILRFIEKHWDNVLILKHSGFFDLRQASGTAHFDAANHIGKVETLVVNLYQKKKIELLPNL